MVRTDKREKVEVGCMPTSTVCRGWISRLMLEHELAELSNRLAVKCWLNHAGKETIKLMEKGKMKNMVVEVKDNIPMVQTRYKKKVSAYFGATELPLILASTNLGYLLCQDAHDACHRGGDMALTVTKQVAYVMGAKNLLQSIRRKCMTCREELAVPERQRMVDIPVEQQGGDGPFKKIALDLAGPFMMKADMRRRSQRGDSGKTKVRVVIIVCQVTSAVKLYISKDYLEEGFLQAWSQHRSDWGNADLVYSDRGTQLVSAAGAWIRVTKKTQ